MTSQRQRAQKFMSEDVRGMFDDYHARIDHARQRREVQEDAIMKRLNEELNKVQDSLKGESGSREDWQNSCTRGLEDFTQTLSNLSFKMRQEYHGQNLDRTAQYHLQASPELQQIRQLEAENDQLRDENSRLQAVLQETLSGRAGAVPLPASRIAAPQLEVRDVPPQPERVPLSPSRADDKINDRVAAMLYDSESD